ncbi:MAG: hypothetical protein V3U21_04235, partial [Thermodesulfobacteriota bacterium]
LFAGNYLINQKEIAVGVAAGGLLFLIDFVIIKFLVNSILTKRFTTQLTLFLFAIKLLVLLGILMTLLIFAKLNIYGFIIALTGIVIVIIGRGLKGNNDGTF